MPSTKELRVWLIVGVGLLAVMLGWSIADQLLCSTGGTQEEVVRHLQRHTRLVRSFLVVFAGVVISGMTRWVYWALCSALDTAKNEEHALQQMDAQALLDFGTRQEAKDGVDHGQEA